jgi:hypothetical protein
VEVAWAWLSPRRAGQSVTWRGRHGAWRSHVEHSLPVVSFDRALNF